MLEKLVRIFTSRKSKRYMLAISDTFPIWHSRALENTHFASLIKAESGSPKRKIHDIRQNSLFWEEASRKINSGQSVLRVCYIIDGVDGEKYHPIILLSNIGVQELLITADGGALVDGSAVDIETLARNEGLSKDDFLDWYGRYAGEKLSIIHFTDYRYKSRQE